MRSEGYGSCSVSVSLSLRYNHWLLNVALIDYYWSSIINRGEGYALSSAFHYSGTVRYSYTNYSFAMYCH